ncbi:hypothetical protein CRM22_011225 [Opisthorchis felineus]|uniref:SEA domain-containing protein n=1 Tax=Opisthorchis felineus TaxID=147828 RepID=A0A4S2K1W7_OPIFE|nr:hypothetical protein CRM22_011225 [Opisthorchis felineus]
MALCHLNVVRIALYVAAGMPDTIAKVGNRITARPTTYSVLRETKSPVTIPTRTDDMETESAAFQEHKAATVVTATEGARQTGREITQGKGASATILTTSDETQTESEAFQEKSTTPAITTIKGATHTETQSELFDATAIRLVREMTKPPATVTTTTGSAEMEFEAVLFELHLERTNWSVIPFVGSRMYLSLRAEVTHQLEQIMRVQKVHLTLIHFEFSGFAQDDTGAIVALFQLFFDPLKITLREVVEQLQSGLEAIHSIRMSYDRNMRVYTEKSMLQTALN